MKNILFIAHSGKAGGADNVLSYAINNTFGDKVKYKRFVVYPKFQGLDFLKLLNPNILTKSIFYRSNSSNFFKSIICNIINIPGLVYLLIFSYVNKINIIYINSSVNFIGAVLAFLTPAKILWHIHEQPNEKVKIVPNYLHNIYKNFFLSNKFNLIFVSNHSKEIWENTLSINILKANIIYPPIKNDGIIVGNNLNDNEFCYGFLGALVREKNIITLLEAFSEISKIRVNIITKLVIAGNGILRDEIIAKATELDIINRIELLEFNNDVSAFFSKINVLVQPSYNESWGLVAIEALSCSRAVIMTKETGLKEILIDDVDCLFFDPLNKNDLIDKMIFLLDNDVECINLGQNGYSKYMSFNFNENFDNSIKSICEG
ncbi:glycosyltransferase family 4 protein [Flavobacterium sp. 5]|uniref:glycosyltransferase family 4 protein n=1 Tax=Flavobacterium sp. 5 TaxID=2035199 RepID=UPI000C2C012D|nr:glycosyltransferase family 4 protein [Flavobacterium sp. 5]PKB17433.1 glycosyltransferase involved in cell wall biosynthesis [Flavobacterium sp. 5]